MDSHAVAFCRFGAFAFFLDLILQAGRGSLHAVFLAVFIEEFLARFGVGGDFFLKLRLHFFHARFGEGFHGLIHLFALHRQLFAFGSVFQASDDGVEVDVFRADFFDGRAHINAERVADFVSIRLEIGGLDAANNGSNSGSKQDFTVCHSVLSLERLG